MAGLQLSGLASGFDWKSLVDNLMQLERTPITRLEAEKTGNTRKVTALDGLNTRLTELKTAAAALKGSGLFSGRSAAPTTANSLWQASATAGAAVGSYTFDIQQLATAARRLGTTDIGQGLSATDDVSATTLATLSTSTAVKAGTFTVNGQTVTVALTDSLQTVFGKISTATGGAVTAAYSAATDRITFSSGSEILLGASNDTSNFLAVARLANNGTDTIQSAAPLGATMTSVPLANARLRTAITAVDGTGNGSFNLNGVSIAYNVNTDSLSTVLSRISASGAGVTASFDAANDRVVLTNKTTGDVGLAASETAGGLLDALGLTGGSTLARGGNAEFTVNGGPTLTSTSNTLDSAAHGIDGLSVTARTEAAETISVSANTASMRTAIETFVTKFNAVQTYIDDQTKITASNGKVTAALMSDNRDIQSLAQTLRSTVFGAVAGLTGTIKRLEDLGIDFSSTGSQLSIKDSTKLDTALRDRATDVEAYFTQATSGFVDKLGAVFTSALGATGTGGTLGTQKTNLNKSSTSIDEQIAAIERRLVLRRAQLEASFIAMENAQAKLQQMQKQLDDAFAPKSSS